MDNSYEEEAIYEACKLLNITERELINNQYKIVTFKDEELQKKILNINKDVIKNNCEKNLDSLSVVVNNHGHILSYYANSNYNLHNLTRQPASTLKPLAVYLPCIEHNMLSSVSKILDEEINYNGYSPQNADNSYNGYVTAKYALANSLNIPAVKLLDCVGIKKSEEILNSLGINLENKDLNLTLALGSTNNGVKLLDLLAAYNTLSNLGAYKQLCFVSKILNKNGEVIYKHQNHEEQVVDKASCFILNDMLKESSKTGTSKRLNSLNIPVCSKTGTASTSKGNTDLFNISYTSEHSVLSWVADIKNVYLNENLKSSVIPTEINKQILQNLYFNSTPADFIVPNDVLYLPYSSIELENNNVIMEPKTDEKPRFVEYAYFKKGSEPIKNNKNNNITANYYMSKSGFVLEFMAEKNKKYNIYKLVNNEKQLLKEITNSNKYETIVDYNIFKFDNIEYYIEDETNKIKSDIIKIKPKEYLINELNKELTSSKKKWYV